MCKRRKFIKVMAPALVGAMITRKRSTAQAGVVLKTSAIALRIPPFVEVNAWE